MRLGRDSDLKIRNRTFKVTTNLKTGDIPSIETRVLQEQRTIYRKSTEIPHLRPVFQHSQEIAERVDSQHLSVLDLVQKGQIDTIQATSQEKTVGSTAPPLVDELERAVALLAEGDLDRARSLLDAAVQESPDASEARELLEVIQQARAGTARVEDALDDFRAGAEAFAGGKTRRAVELWKTCLAAEPANRAVQLAFLLSSTVSPIRRRYWLQEVLALGSKLLAGNQSAEAYSLLLVAQSAEQQPESPEPGPEESAITIPGSQGARPLPGEVMAHRAPTPPRSTGLTSPEEQPGRSEEEYKTDPIGTAATGSNPPPVDDEGLFTTHTEEEREAALFDARDAEVKTTPPRRSAAEVRPTRGGSARPSGSSPSSMKVVLLAAAALIVAAGLAVTVLLVWLNGEERVIAEALEEAAGFLNGGQSDRAIEAYSSIISTYGDVPPAYLGRARALIGSGDIDRGIVDLRRAVDLEPGAPTVAEELADVLYTRGRFEEAVSYYQRALSAGEIGAEASYRLASSLVAVERADEASPYLKASLEKDPSHGEARLLYGKLLNRAGRFAEAEQLLRDTLSPIDSGGDYYNELCISLLEQNKLEEAEEVAGSFSSHEPNDARPHTLLGEIYARRKQFEPARRELIVALRINPQDSRAQIALGRTWLAIGKTRGDERDLAKARQILTQARGAHEGARLLTLGEVSLAEGDLPEAVRLIDESLSHGANPFSARIALAEAKYRAKDLPGTAAELGRAAGLAPSDPALALSLALVYSELKDGRRASEEFLKSIRGSGMSAPADAANGPVVLPRPYIPIPDRFDVNRIIRAAYRQALAAMEEDQAALELKAYAESTTFVISN